jgi:hypothetical protein
MLHLAQRGVDGNAAGTDMGAYACLDASLFVANREETYGMVADSPGNPLTLCGEVYTLTWGGHSVLQSRVAVTSVGALVTRWNSESEYGAQRSQAGWARLRVNGASANTPVPAVGFAATSFKDLTNGGNFGQTIPHRW